MGNDWFLFLLWFCDWFFKNPITINTGFGSPKFDWVFLVLLVFTFSIRLFVFLSDLVWLISLLRMLDADLTSVLKAGEVFDWERISFILEAPGHEPCFSWKSCQYVDMLNMLKQDDQPYHR